MKSFRSLEIRDNTELKTTSHLRMNTNAEYLLKNVESVIVVSQQRLGEVDGLKGIMTVTGTRLRARARHKSLYIVSL